MIIIFGLVWLILSIFAIYYIDHYYYWNNLFKVFAACCIIAFLFNGWQMYDPTLDHMIVTIETNPTWEAALALSLAEGACMTGPIAWIYILKEKIQERRG